MKKTPADKGWHGITIQRLGKTLGIEKIELITHWTHRHYPVVNNEIFFIYTDTEEIVLNIEARYIMDPLGRLLDHDKVVIANSVFDLQALVTYRHRCHEPELPASA